MGSAERAALELRFQIPVMGRSEERKCLGIEDRQHISVGLGDDVFDPVDLVRRVGGWWGKSGHVWRQSYGNVVVLIGIGGYADRAFEKSGELLEIGLAWVVVIEREGQFGTGLGDGLLGIWTGLPAHVPHLAVRFYVEFVVEAQTVEPMDRFPFIPAPCGDAECARAGTIEYAGEPRWDLAANLELYGIWLLSCVVEAMRDCRLEGLLSG